MTSWRSVLPVHPAAELFPLMSADELRALGEDICKHGLREPVVLQKQYRRRADGSLHVGEYDLVLLDGRNRLDAMERAGFALIRDGKLDKTLGHRALGLEPLTGGGYAELDSDVDPYAFVISCNIHRRHLTAEKKRELIGKLIKADPSKSDRQIGETIKADHKTVASKRWEMEGRGEIPHVAKREDSKGRKQPAKKQGAKRQTESSKQRAEADRQRIGRNSDNEVERLRARNEELERENLALRSEVDELKAELAKRAPRDDGLDIPAYLRRSAGP